MDQRSLNSLIAGILTGSIALIPFIARRDQVTKLFFLSNFFLACWNLADLIVRIPRNEDVILFFYRTTYIFGVLVVWYFYLFMLEFARISYLKFPKVYFAGKWVGLFLMGSSFSNFLVKDLQTTEKTFIEIPGPGMPFFIIYLVAGLGFALFQVFSVYKHSKGLSRTQLGYMFLALSFVFAEALIFFSTLYIKNVPPYYFYLQVAYGLTLSYAIARYKLMDINLVFRYATIYLLFAVSLAIPFSAFAIFSSSKIVVVLTILVAFLLAPIIERKSIDWFRSFVDKLPPFRGRYQFLNDTPGFQRLISSSASVKHWAANLADSVNRLLEVSHAAVFVLDENHQMYMAMSAVGVDFGKMIYASPKETDSLVLHLKTTRKTLQKEYVDYEVAETERQSVLNSLSLIKAELCIPFFNADRLIGFVSIGPKHERGLNLFRPGHFNLNSILEYLDFAPTSTPAFAYVHRLLCVELGIQKSGDAFKLSALQVADGFNRLVNRAGWVEKIPRVEHLPLHSEGISLLDRLKSRTAEHVATLMPVEEATLNAAVLAYFYQAELRGYWREDNFNDEDTKALSGLVRGAEGALMVIFVTLAGQMKSVEWAHDLRHPFVKGSFRILDALLTGKMGPLTPDQYHALAHIQADAKFVESRITDLVSPENSGIIKKNQININDLLRAVGERYRYFAGISGIDFRLMTPPEDVWVQCDAELIQYRVFNNLLDNAMRHTPKGGVVELGVSSVTKEPMAHCFVRNRGSRSRRKRCLICLSAAVRQNGLPRGKRVWRASAFLMW
ncbi:MAG: hypothetical protein IPN23_07900 [Elusimicrobia bacterium]|nr:hypothetical protein [Elusimicrobiota bacterium]